MTALDIADFEHGAGGAGVGHGDVAFNGGLVVDTTRVSAGLSAGDGDCALVGTKCLLLGR